MTRLLLAVAILSCAMAASAQTSSFTYQGRLTNSSAPASGTFTIKFDLYNAATGGSLLATESQSVTVANGVFTVTLDFGAAAFDGTPRFLEITVAGAALSPRKAINSAPYAMQAANAAKLGGVEANQYVLTDDSRLSDSRPASSIDLNNAAVAGVLPIANGGTGSSTQNFVDLTTAQIVAGAKTFSNSSNVFSGTGAGLTGIAPANISGGTAAININGISAKAATSTSGATPSVTDLTLLVLNYGSVTTVTDLPGGIDGQCVVLVTLNNKVTISDSGNFRLSRNWTPFPDDTLTLCRSAASGSPLWYERARSDQGLVLTVSRSGNGDGTVTSNLAGINCGSDCQEPFASGTVVQLTAAPDASSTFAGWSGACSGVGTCNVTIDSAKSVSATFQRRSYSLAISKTLGGTVTSSPAGIYCGVQCLATIDAGTVVTLTSSPDLFATFGGWGGACSGTASTCIVTMDAGKSVTARFTFPLTVTKSGTGSGTVTSNVPGINCGANCTAPLDGGTTVQLTATPSGGSIFAGWSGACSGIGSCVVTMDSVKNVTATFTINTFSLTVSRSGTGTGTVISNPAGINCGGSCSAVYDGGTVVQLIATASTGSNFTGWSGGGCSGPGICTVTMNVAATVTATFTATHVLSVVRTGTGSGAVTSNPSGINCGTDCSEAYDLNTSVQLVATPGIGSTFAGWNGACTGPGACLVTMTSGLTVAATFDNPSPTVVNVTSSTANGSYGLGAVIGIQVTFSETVTVTGSPTLALNSGGMAPFAGGSGTNTLTFGYTIGGGQNSPDLESSAVLLNGGTIRDVGSNNAVLTLPAPGSFGSLGANKNIVVDTISPVVTNVTSSTPDGVYSFPSVINVQVVFSETVIVTGTPRIQTLDTGGIANYVSGSGTNTLNFNYTIQQSHATGDLDYVSANSLVFNGGTIRDLAANSAFLALPAPGGPGSLGFNKDIVIEFPKSAR